MQPPTAIRRSRVGSMVLAAVLLGSGTVLVAWKHNRLAAEKSAVQPEPVEAVTIATAASQAHRETTTAIGTVLALESITLRNELPGTVRHVSLVPGAIVEAGTVLVALDTSVETADLRALQAQAVLAETTLRRHVYLRQHEANSEAEVDEARAQRDVSLAQVERLKATIAKKIIRAPFRARVGLSDVHPGQYLNEGVELTTLQGVGRGCNVDFSVAQSVAAALTSGCRRSTWSLPTGASRSPARIVGDRREGRSRDPERDGAGPDLREQELPSPGRLGAGTGPARAPATAVAVPVSALRKGPGRRPRLRDRRGSRQGKPAPTCDRCRPARCWETRC